MGRHAKQKDRTNITQRIALAATVGMGATVALPATFASAETMSDWNKIAHCEADGRWNRPDGDHGKSSGGLQFQRPSWSDALRYLRTKGINTSRYPSMAYQATKNQQILAGEALLAMQGPGAWAVTRDANGGAKGCHGLLRDGSVFEGGPSPFGGASLQSIANGGAATPAPAPKPKPGPAPKPPADRPEAEAPHDHYRVKGGDTLSSIAGHFKIKGGWEELYRWNTRAVADPDVIEPGMLLNIPRQDRAAPEEPPAPKPEPKPVEKYTVVPGDNLYDISIRHGVGDGGLDTWKPLYEANREVVGGNPHLIFPGQQLVIPAGKAPAPAPEPKPAPKPKKATVKVKDGDTLSAIAAAYAVPGGWEALYRANTRIVGSNPDKIEIGMVLTLPDGSRTSPAPKPPSSKPKPSSWVHPVAGARLSQPFRNPSSGYTLGYHTGVDFSASSGTPVKAPTAAVVVASDTSSAYGVNVQLRHADGKHTLYAHLSSKAVSVGQRVDAGDVIGRVGSTGNSSGPHLHMELRLQPRFAAGNFLDPAKWLRSHGVRL